MTIRTNPSQRLAILLILGGLQILAYYFVGSMLTPRPFSVALPQPDTLLYCQSAKQIAHGQPFIFSPGEAPSTGCTSHLYPFLLAVPYLLGMHGATLLLGGFILNALLYLAFLYAWHHIFEELLEDDRAKLCASVLLGLFGQSACCALGQTDTGLIMAVTAGVFAAWLKNRRLLVGILLALSPWCRPEGMMLIAAFGFVFVCSFVRLFVCSSAQPRQAGASHENHTSHVTRHTSRVHGDFIAVCVAAISALGVFTFNYLLTGQHQFHSVEFKGYFGNLPLADATLATLIDFLAMLRQLLLGQPAGSIARETYMTPFFGAILGLAGFLTFNWRKHGVSTYCWLLACLLSLASVASSGWQGTNFDRYLAWLLPTGLIFTSHGIVTVAELPRCGIRYERVAVIPILLQLVSAVAAIGWFAKGSRLGQIDYETYVAINEAIASTDGDVGVAFSVGGAYLFDGRRTRHLRGYYSPAFRAREPICNLEVIKHEADKRFDYWLAKTPKLDLSDWDATPLTEKQVFQGMNQFSLWKTDWTSLDAALGPCTTNAPIGGLTISDRVDVGYLHDEQRTQFRVNYRLPGLSYLPFAMDGECEGTRIVDVGRPVIGWADMRVRLKPGTDVTAVIRTATNAGQVQANMYASFHRVSLKSSMRLNVFVDGKPVTSVQTTLDDGNGKFSEVTFRISGEAIKNETSLVQIFGDHLAFAYWFYQETSL